MKYPQKFSWFLGVALVLVALQSGACTYDSCETNKDCDQAAGEICILPGGSCGLKATFCRHGERRPCKPGTHSRGTTRDNVGVCNKEVSGEGRVEVCVGGAWVASRTRFDEVRRQYVENNYVAMGIPGFDLSEEFTYFEALPKNEVDSIDLAIERKEYVLCGYDTENEDFVGGDVDPLWISREICNGLNDDCNRNPRDPKDPVGLVDDDFIGERAIRVTRLNNGQFREERDAARFCVTGQADADGRCLCAEPGSLGTCQRRGVQVCDVIPRASSGFDYRLGCSSVAVQPDPTRLACNGQDDNCNGVVDEFTISQPVITYGGQNINDFNPNTNTWAAAIIGPNARTNKLFAIERNARQALTQTNINRLPKIDLKLLETSNEVGDIRREILRPGGADLFGLSPIIHVIEGAQAAASSTTEEYAVVFYLSQVEFNCTNGLDDDGDGLIDCDDRGECNPDQCGELNSGPQACRDGRDGDRDGLIDCDDSECFNHPDCNDEKSENCSDNIDNNQNGLTDCADPICFSNPKCAEQAFVHFSRPELCGNGLDDDGDGLIDCEDPECCNIEACSSMPICRIEPLCDSVSFPGLDGDGDGFIGCNDPDCCALPDCAGQGVCARKCENCNDPFCEGSAACPTFATAASPECADCGGNDPGLVARCRTLPRCHEDCTDGIDNNGDGLADCADLRCINTPLCKRIHQRGETCVAGDDVPVNCNNPICRTLTRPDGEPRYCLSTPPLTNPCLENVGGQSRCKSDLACLYNPACLPCNYGGSACERTACDDHPLCVPDAPNCQIAANCSNPACADSPFCYSACLNGSICANSPELCNNNIDDNGDGLIDCEDFASCGYSVFCTQELLALSVPFEYSTTSGILTDESRPSNIVTNDVCISCSDDGIFQVGRITDPTLGLSRPRFKNRPTFFKVLPRQQGNTQDFFILYGREAQTGFRLYSSRITFEAERVSATSAQQARLIGTSFSGIIRDAALTTVSTTSSEVRMALIEETRNSDGDFLPNRLGKLSLYRGSVTSSGAIDIYAADINNVDIANATNAGEEQLSRYEIPLGAYARPGTYPMSLLAFDDETWLAFVTGAETPQLRVHGYRQVRTGGFFKFDALIDGDRAVAYPLKRVNEGWVLSTRPIPGDDKNPLSSSILTFDEVSNVNLTPVCFDLGNNRSQCDQALLSFDERARGTSDRALHLLQINLSPNRVSRIRPSGTPDAIPLAAVINESKPRDGEYQTIPAGKAPKSMIKKAIVNGYRLQVGGFGAGQTPEFDFLTSLDQVPEHVRFAKVIDPVNNNLVGYFAQSQADKSRPLLPGSEAIEPELAKCPNPLAKTNPSEPKFIECLDGDRTSINQITVNLTLATRTDFHIHWGGIVSTTDNNFAPYVEELKCDTPPGPSFNGYGLADPSALVSPPGQ